MPVANDFDYSADANGGKCPFHAHIRKSNPRGSSPGGLAFDKSVQMARRGITYGARLQDPDTKELVDQPNDGVGLLFMSYQASIEQQFHFMQTAWVNNENFPKANIGVDPIIGQRGALGQHWPPTYGSDAGAIQKLFSGFVTLKGGEYFFAPSIAGLRKL
jgi:deferrochelatase/peroxidase EfeB